jgi:predicted metal-dependent peptidase
MNALSKMENARTRLLLKRPFYGALALRLEIVEDNTQPTAYTDGKVIGFNSHFVDQIDKQESLFLVLHEVLHCILKHPWRKGTRDHELFNQAGDYVINLVCLIDGFKLLTNVLLDNKYDGKSTEWVYADLERQRRANQNNGDSCDAGEEGGGNDSPSTSQEYGPGDVPTFSEAVKSGQFGEFREATDENGNADTESADEWEGAVQIAVAQEKARGTMSAKALASIQGRNEGMVDWSETLANFLSDSGNNFDTTWAKPNRRFIGRGQYLPSMKREGIDHVVIAVDTSGSVSDSELKQFMSETIALVEQMDCSITVIPCDSRIGKVLEFESYDVPEDVGEFKLGGRGGTSFKPPFRWVEDNMDSTPTALIYFTDGECNYPDEPDYPVFWAISNTYGFSPAPWGTSVEVV